ncbi:MAG: class I SAM-dependent methyltransferase [Thermodesulfobacteriota bacterium]|nr:class I SAM-dependent methyltransferase [Thermodesulfobacteriota bacterium]
MPFQKRYKSGNTPWEIHRADHNLISIVRNTPVQPCKALDIGCGSGDNVIWLQQQKFEAVGVDSTEIAINQARKKAQKSKADCLFYELDFFSSHLPGLPYDFAFDRGCFHHFRDDKLSQFAEKVAAILKIGGLWLTLAGNADETREGSGPPQLSAGKIVNAVEPCFKILSLVSSHFDTDQKIPAKNWVCLMKKR